MKPHQHAIIRRNCIICPEPILALLPERALASRKGFGANRGIRIWEALELAVLPNRLRLELSLDPKSNGNRHLAVIYRTLEERKDCFDFLASPSGAFSL